MTDIGAIVSRRLEQTQGELNRPRTRGDPVMTTTTTPGPAADERGAREQARCCPALRAHRSERPEGRSRRRRRRARSASTAPPRPGPSNAIAEAFKKKYGINVSVYRAGSADVATRVQAEESAGRTQADALIIEEPALSLLVPFLAAYDSPERAAIDAAYKAPQLDPDPHVHVADRLEHQRGQGRRAAPTGRTCSTRSGRAASARSTRTSPPPRSPGR